MDDFSQTVKDGVLQKLDVKEVHINSVTHIVIQILEEEGNLLSTDIVLDSYYDKYKNGEPIEGIINNIIYDYYRICMERDTWQKENHC